MTELERPEMGTPNDPTAGGPDVDVHTHIGEDPEMDRPARGTDDPEVKRPKDPNA